MSKHSRYDEEMMHLKLLMAKVMVIISNDDLLSEREANLKRSQEAASILKKALNKYKM